MWSSQAFWIVVRRDGIVVGKTSLVLWMLASPLAALSLSTRPVPATRLTFGSSSTESCGLNGSAAQFVAWNGYLPGNAPSGTPAAPHPVSVPVTSIGLQLVGLNVKP